MICLVLTVFANLFPAAYAGVHERTFLAVKPDGVQRRLVGEVVRRFERKGFKLVALKLVQASEELLHEHYAELRERPFYGRLVKYMGSGPVVAMVWQGLDVVRASRALIGATDPADALPGTIRGDFCVEERDPRQRLGGERPPRDRALVPRRGAPVLGGQRRALAARVACASGSDCDTCILQVPPRLQALQHPFCGRDRGNPAGPPSGWAGAAPQALACTGPSCPRCHHT
ncbi:PREDICTED: nucleoside diphosphate kinase 3 isoform X2 [Propithecus coquereli]|uniref:nucleoside diphosphate kinase 3 isoform X2 n=1 Tax=Propithecus coquereli TaxID=379532 RepID=UPI00063EF01C|nr:PREDICTED: nucleoside diphosphate kinase 3 isoform X2 [Propithecus coquereli]